MLDHSIDPKENEDKSFKLSISRKILIYIKYYFMLLYSILYIK